MKNWRFFLCIFVVIVLVFGCESNTLPEKFEISFAPAAKYEGPAQGTAIIDTKTGTDVVLSISGLESGKVYTAFFVNVKSQMFQGIGQDPFVLPIDAAGNAEFTAKIPKDSYKRYKTLAIYLNPSGKPVANPVGVKAKLGAFMKGDKAQMIIVAKLR
jgi:hypothetical protein